MSLEISWSSLVQRRCSEIIEDCIRDALKTRSSELPSVIQDHVLSLCSFTVGEEPPQLKIEEWLDDSNDDTICLKLSFSYNGNACASFRCILQANLLSFVGETLCHEPLLSHEPLPLQLELKLCKLQISGIVTVRINYGALDSSTILLTLDENPFRGMSVESNYEESIPKVHRLVEKHFKEFAFTAGKRLANKSITLAF